ncbi:MAG TPA: metalloregulator ArsR/SmtB family transcription factor [Gemmatimonadales bacterium]
MARTRLTAQTIDLVAERFRTLGEPMRLRLLEALRSGEHSVGDLVELTGGGQANVSKHLQILLTGGLVGRRKDGTTVLYRLADPSVFQLCDIVCGRVEAQAEARHKALRN